MPKRIEQFSIQLDDKQRMRREDLEILAARTPGRSVADVIKALIDEGVDARPINEEERANFRARKLAGRKAMNVPTVGGGLRALDGTQEESGGEDGIRTHVRRVARLQRLRTPLHRIRIARREAG